MLDMRGSANWMRIINMPLFLLIGLLLINWPNVNAQTNELPCDFLDSVNITGGIYQSDNSILFDGIEFSVEQYAELNYTLDRGTKTIPVESYIRGCLCDRVLCVRLCCPLGTANRRTKGGLNCVPHDDANDLDHDIIDENNATIPTQIDQFFSITHSLPCKMMYISDNDFQITHKGHIIHEDSLLNHRQYCIQAAVNETENTVNWNLLVCLDDDDAQHFQALRYIILAISMLISVLSIIATEFVYACVPKLRNLNGKCLMCYLASLAIGYTLVSLLQLNGINHIEPMLCYSVAHLIYFSLLSAFLWLNVVNFDLWQSFQSTSGFNRFSERTRFLLYCLYAFGISCVLTLLVSIYDRIESIPEYLRPRLGIRSCFLHPDWFTQFLFFYIPIGIIISLNILLFILTTIRIRQVNQEAIRMRSQEDSSKLRRSLNKKKESIKLYFQLFVIAGISWTLEVISFLFARDSFVFIASDVWNCLQGFLIFLLLIMRRHVLRLIKERWNFLFGKPNRNESAASNSNASTNYLRLNSLTSAKQ